MRFKFFILLFFCSFNLFADTIDDGTLESVYEKYKDLTNGKVASYIPELAKVNPNYFAISIVTVDGKVFSVGDADTFFSLQSISKVFSYALALNDNGEKKVFEQVGLDATGEQFNSLKSIENEQSHNPFVNAGAIQTASLIKYKNAQTPFERLLKFMSQFSNQPLALNREIYLSESQSNLRNQAISQLLKSKGLLKDDPRDVLDLYTKTCSLMVNTKVLALMGATLANGGVNPINNQKVLSEAYVRDVLSQMTINGIYERSGTWFVNIGIPAKSGVSGGILAVVPNRMAIAVFAPPLDETGTSVKGQAVLKELSRRWNLHLFSNKKITG
jgi:glutaminase